MWNCRKTVSLEEIIRLNPDRSQSTTLNTNDQRPVYSFIVRGTGTTRETRTRTIQGVVGGVRHHPKIYRRSLWITYGFHTGANVFGGH